jgi:hypothetical protein
MLSIVTKLLVDRKPDGNGTVGLLYSSTELAYMTAILSMRKASGHVLAWEERSGDEAEIAGPKICQASLQKTDCVEETPFLFSRCPREGVGDYQFWTTPY